jgi:hypothetical protein
VVISWASDSWPVINRKSDAWIRSFGPNCTINQLNIIYNEIGNYTDYLKLLIRIFIAMDIVGHEKPNITFGHYSGGTSMEQKYDAVCKSISYSFHDSCENQVSQTR